MNMMTEFTNNFALEVTNQPTLTEQQVIQLLKMQIIKFEDLPPAVKSAVEDALSENADTVTAGILRKEKVKLIRRLGAALDRKSKKA